MTVIIRGYVDGKCEFEHRLCFEGGERELARLSSKYIGWMADHEQHMFEIEFLDEPDPGRRYLRLGADPARMIQPVKWIRRAFAGLAGGRGRNRKKAAE